MCCLMCVQCKGAQYGVTVTFILLYTYIISFYLLSLHLWTMRSNSFLKLTHRLVKDSSSTNPVLQYDIRMRRSTYFASFDHVSAVIELFVFGRHDK